MNQKMSPGDKNVEQGAVVEGVLTANAWEEGRCRFASRQKAYCRLDVLGGSALLYWLVLLVWMQPTTLQGNVTRNQLECDGEARRKESEN